MDSVRRFEAAQSPADMQAARSATEWWLLYLILLK